MSATITPASDRRELLRAAYPILLAIASGNLPAAGEMWDYAADRVELAGVAIDVCRSQAGAVRLVAYLEAFEAAAIE